MNLISFMQVEKINTYLPEKVSQFQHQVGQYSGLAVTWIRGHLQDKRIAYSSLIFANVISFALATTIALRLEDKFREHLSDERRSIGKLVVIATYLSIYALGNYAFYKFAQLPIGKVAFTAVSVASFIFSFVAFALWKEKK